MDNPVARAAIEEFAPDDGDGTSAKPAEGGESAKPTKGGKSLSSLLFQKTYTFEERRKDRFEVMANAMIYFE